MDSASLAKVMRRVEDWKLKLIDLSRRNRLVHFRPTRSSNIRFERPGMEAVFERLVVKDRPWEIWQPPEEDRAGLRGRSRGRPRKTQLVPSEVEPGQLNRIMRNLARRSASEYRERGVRILYMTFGMLDWKEAGANHQVKSPIVLTPVELTRKTSRDPYRIQVPAVEEEAILNPALRLKLQYDHQIELPPLPDFEEENIAEYLRDVEEAVAGMGWEVKPVVQMGLFSFHKLVMYQDLNDNVDRIVEHPVVSALAGATRAPMTEQPLPLAEELDSLDPGDTFQVLDADSSQQLCIQYALAGQSFVMHGPPGTGKSQTIANMISEFIAHGKSVLFVSEKMAALEVVYSRLKARNLDDYCLELHSHKANKREVVAELSRSLSEHLKARGALSDEELDRLEKRRDQLNGYVEALHAPRSPIGMTAYQLFGRLARLEETSLVPTSYTKFKTLDQRKLLELEDMFRRLSNAWAVVEEGEGFPWRGCTEESFSPETRSNWIHLLDATLNTIAQLGEESKFYAEALELAPPSTLGDHERLQRLTEIISATPRPPLNWFEDADLNKIQAIAVEKRGKWESYWTTVRSLEKGYDPRFLVLPPGSADRVERAWTRVKELLAPVSKGDGGLMRQMEELDDYLRGLPDRLREWKRDAGRIGSLLGVKGDIQTIERISQLSELAQLCREEVRPMRAWLDRKTLDETRGLLDSLNKDYVRRDKLRARLEGYDEGLLSLNLNELIEWFEGPGSSILRILRPSYYRVRGVISGVSKNRTFPETALEDLKTAKELKILEEEMESNRGAVRNALGVYYKGEEPDFEGAERALQTAAKAIRIAGRARAPKALRDNLCAGTQPSEVLISVGDRLRKALTRWRSETRRLRRLIPSMKIPATGLSLRKSTQGDLEGWAGDAVERLSQLSRVGAEALATRISDHPSTYEDLIVDLRTVGRLQRFEDEVEGRSEELTGVFGQLYTGLRTDWDKVLGAIGWTRSLIRALTDGVPPELKRAVSEEGPPLPRDPQIARRLERISSSLDTIDDSFEFSRWPEPREGLILDDIGIGLTGLRSRIDDLQTWVDFKELEGRLGEEGLGKFLEKLVSQKCEGGQILPTFQKAIYQGLLDMVFKEDPALKVFRGKGHEQLIKDFQELDQRFIRLSAQRVIEIANQQKPQGVFVQAPDSEITVLMREAAKKRRHMPLRHLFERIPNLIRRLKPCMMMSPISVSQFLIPGGLHFDLVVFDEASQIYTEDAVGAIYRGDRLVVAGDPKQLPPTPFFQYTIDEDFDWDEEAYEFDVFDSVLDECMSIGLPVQMLRWHYRSKHDSLISFSNERFYNGNLVLFPASRMGSEDLGLEFVHVKDGIYERGGRRNNQREAEVVADLVFDHFGRYPEKTLGVVTFSISQMNTVQDAVERHLRERPKFEKFFVEDRLNGFFVKNLENVQGDERDVMIFSVGYGYDQDGKITMNFGPLNKQGGERRLNVAVTRARERVILVSSIRYDDIRLESTQAEGVHSLHHYLRYAERRPKNLLNGEVGGDFASPLELDVAEEVERLGYKAIPWVGSSSFRVDLGVVDPEDQSRFLLGIMCDGDNYRSASTSRDRDRLRLQVLESLGWRIHRVWSPDWVQRHGTEARRLERALREAEKGAKKVVAKKERARPKRNEVRKVRVKEAPGDELPEVEPYRFANLRPRHLFSRYSPEHRERYLRQYHSEVRRLLPQLVRVEGPIHVDLAFRRMNSAFRLSRATQSFRKAFMGEVEKAGKKSLRVRGVFLWPRDLERIQVRVPVEGVKESFRSIEYVPSEEIRQAMLLVAGHSLGLREESFINETARLLGFKRMGVNILDSLRSVYEKAREDGVLALEEGLVTLVGTSNE